MTSLQLQLTCDVLKSPKPKPNPYHHSLYKGKWHGKLALDVGVEGSRNIYDCFK